MDTNKIRGVIGLLNSMVNGGEKHTETTENIVQEALGELAKPYDIEFLSEQVHNAWWEENKLQGFHAPTDCPTIKNKCWVDKLDYKFDKLCPTCHTDMYKYNELPENIKDYDRVMVKSVLEAIKKMEG